ncbi:MAG: M64 family metallopeptidase [Deltaproteobacteria bacterium]|nr:M64 family metallopeptidase [Deltaproteobacteria bacterium]
MRSIVFLVLLLVSFFESLYAGDIIEMIIEYERGKIDIVSYIRTHGFAEKRYGGEYTLSVLDDQSREIFFTTFNIPLFIDVPPDPYTGESFQIKIEKNSAVVRIPFDPKISKIKINSIVFNVKLPPFATSLSPPPTEVILGSCSGNSCFDFLFVADNYGSDLSQFKTDARTIANFFGSIEPFKSNLNRIRIIRVDNTSSLGCYNNCNGIQRLICCDANKVFSAVAGLSYDEILVITNMNEYGGSGHKDSSQCGDEYTYAVTFRDISYYAKEVAVHEVGHSFGGLWDEYEYGIDGYGEGPNCVWDSECTKWAGVPGTGCFAGCSYNGMYRPTENSCLMRTLSPTGGYKFCPVCKDVVDMKLRECFSSNCSPSCLNKECGDDGCGGSCGTCNSPPHDICVDEQTLRAYSTFGTCVAGRCEYSYTDKKCSYLCEGNRCIPVPYTDVGFEIVDTAEIKNDERDISVDILERKDNIVVATDSRFYDSEFGDVGGELNGFTSDDELSGCSCLFIE